MRNCKSSLTDFRRTGFHRISCPKKTGGPLSLNGYRTIKLARRPLPSLCVCVKNKRVEVTKPCHLHILSVDFFIPFHFIG